MKCEYCDGKGLIYTGTDEWDNPDYETCLYCDGKGYIKEQSDGNERSD